jgi:hypothetical protein
MSNTYLFSSLRDTESMDVLRSLPQAMAIVLKIIMSANIARTEQQNLSTQLVLHI